MESTIGTDIEASSNDNITLGVVTPIITKPKYLGMRGIKLECKTPAGLIALKDYVNECTKGQAAKTVGLGNLQLRTAKKIAIKMPYTEEVFPSLEDPSSLVVMLERAAQSHGYKIIPKVEIMINTIMKKYGAESCDYTVEIL